MGNFNKKPNSKKVNFFCDWFINYQKGIVESYKDSNPDSDLLLHHLNEVKACLSVPYRDGFKGEIEVGIGYNEDLNKLELDLYHGDDKFLIQLTQSIKSYLDNELSNDWIINIKS